MRQVWELTDLEFVTLWNQADGNMVPTPLSYATDIPTWGALAAAKAEIADRVHQLRRAGAGIMIDALADADIRVTALGRNGSDFDDPEGAVRIVGARKGRQGWVIRQKPGKTVWHSGGFVVSECEAIHLAAAVVANLPETDAGRIPEVVLSRDTAEADENDGSAMDYSYGRSAVFQTTEVSVGDTVARRFLATPTASVGTIEISQERSAFGPRGRVRSVVQWRDVVDDGRYVISADTPSVAHAADRSRVVDLINIEIAAAVRNIKDESA